MHILIIGGNGFIGSHLVDHLLSKGHQVRVFDVAYEHFRAPLKQVDYRIASIESIPDLYQALMGIDMVFHLASTSVPSTSNIDPVSDVQHNLIPTLNVLNLSVKLGVKRIVCFSSGGAVYGNPLTSTVSEDHPLNPISSYGIVKTTIEMYMSLYQRLHGIQPLILRPSNPYGPRQGHYKVQGVISTFLRKAMNNEPLTIFGNGDARKDYIYIDDLIDMCCRLSFSNEVGVYNVGTGVGTSINEIVQQVKTQTQSDVVINKSEKAIYDVDHFVLDIGKTIDLLGECKFTSLEEGIAKTWSWMTAIEESL